MAGTDVQYATETIGDGGADAAVTAEAAGAVAAEIASIEIDAAVFGRVDEAATLATDLTAFRDGAAALGRAVQTVHDDLADRADSAARQGDRMVDDTTAQADSVPVPAVAGGVGR